MLIKYPVSALWDSGPIQKKNDFWWQLCGLCCGLWWWIGIRSYYTAITLHCVAALPLYMISHTQIPVFVCVKDGGMLRKRFDFRKHTTYIIGQMYEILRCFCFKCLYWSLVVMYIKLSTSDRDYFLPFFNIFCAKVHPVRRQSHAMFTMWESPMM